MSAPRKRAKTGAQRRSVNSATGGLGILNYGTASGNQMRSEFYEHLEKIEAMYEVSGVQSVAVNAYMNSILSTGLRFKRDGSPARGMVLTTVLDWIKNLCLYGFCCFRVLVDEKPGDPNFPVQVPSGRELPVRFSGSKLRWVPDLKKGGTEAPFPISTADSDEDDDGEDENSPFAWHCIVYQPPTESRCTSFAAQSYDDSLRIEELYKNSAERDFFNSRPNAFVSVNEADFSARGRAGGQSFLKSGLDIDSHTGEEGMTRGMNYEELLATRAAVLRGLADGTDRTDYAATAGRHDRVGVGLHSTELFQEREAIHRELVISDGRKATPAPPLHGQDHLDRLIVRLRLNVLESFGVAPQFVGESVSAERVGSNAQSTTKAMDMFQIRARTMRNQLPVELLGLEFADLPQDKAVLERIFPLLTPEAAIDMTASLYGIDASMLDKDRIVRQQDAMIGDKMAGPTAPSTAPEGLKTGERKHKTEIDKEITALNKGSTI